MMVLLIDIRFDSLKDERELFYSEAEKAELFLNMLSKYTYLIYYY